MFFNQMMQPGLAYPPYGMGLPSSIRADAGPQIQVAPPGGKAPVTPAMQPQGGGHGQSPGFFGSMLQNPTQMAAGLGLMGKGAAGLSSLFGSAAASMLPAAASPFAAAAPLTQGATMASFLAPGAVGASGGLSFLGPLALAAL